jgi:hypothetical protein
MEQTAIFSRRIRWVAIATGVASALALFPILFLLQPALMIAGGLLQPRFPTTGKWFVWTSAANLWAVVIVYDRMMFQDLWSQTKTPEYIVLAFSATTVLLTWFSVELVADALRRMRARRAIPPAEPRPMSRGVWIFAAVLNLLLGWELLLGWGATEWVLASSWYRYSVIFYNLAMPGNLAVIIVVAFDISVIWRVVKLRWVPRANLDGMQ